MILKYLERCVQVICKYYAILSIQVFSYGGRVLESIPCEYWMTSIVFQKVICHTVICHALISRFKEYIYKQYSLRVVNDIKKCQLLSCVQLFATPCTVACQGPLSMGFSRQEYWSGQPFPSPGILPKLGIKPRSPSLQTDSLLSKSLQKPIIAQKKETKCIIKILKRLEFCEDRNRIRVRKRKQIPWRKQINKINTKVFF